MRKMLIYNTRKLAFGLFRLVAFFVVSCSSDPMPFRATPSVAPSLAAPITSVISTPSGLLPAPQPNPTPNGTYGVTVNIVGACSDGFRTFLHLQTELDVQYWGLNASHFHPWGDVYFETAITFLENGQLFSSTSSGKRGPPSFDLLNQIARVDQSFIFPEAPSLNSQYSLKAEVTLLSLPSNYQPPVTVPTAIAPVASTAIGIPTRFNFPVMISACS